MLGISKKEIQDCFFIQDDKNYFIVPIGSEVNINIFSAENFIPLEWFLMFSQEEKHYFYTHTGFGAVEQDAIYYNATVADATDRLSKSKRNIKAAISRIQEGTSQPFAEALRELNENIVNLENWLSGFDPKSFIILNYGEICSHIEPNTMKNEDSVSEIQRVLSLAADGSTTEAESALYYLLSKWVEIKGAATGERSASASTVQ